MSAPGAEFAYNNGGYVVLALIAERTARRPFDVLVRERVCQPAGIKSTGFLRSDEFPGQQRWATCTLRDCAPTSSTSPCSEPVTAASTRRSQTSARSWRAFLGGRIVSPDPVAQMVRPRSCWPEEERRYGLGFHVHATTDVVWLEGYDVGSRSRVRTSTIA